MLMLLLGCGGLVAPMPIVDASGGFFDAPWPSETRLSADGGLDMAGFPLRDEQALVQQYVELAEQEGATVGTNTPIYFRFEGALDTERLPGPFQSAVGTDPALFLIDIDPRSPTRGERVPIYWDFQEDSTTFQPDNLLTMAPVPGAPMRPNTRYAAVVTTEVARVHPATADRWSPEHPDHAAWEDLQTALFELGVGVEEVAVATQFVTGDPTAEMAVLTEHIRSTMGIQELGQPLEFVESGIFFQRWEGELYVPLWQHGERPYGSEGGGFSFDDSGTPELFEWERVRFTLTAPLDTSPPEDGWPVVIYSHGTGGDWTSFAVDASGMGEAARAAQAGALMIGISQPLHGDRATPGTDPEFHTFNYFNPDSALANFRQGALDTVYLAHVLAGASHTFGLDGESVRTNPDQVFFMGHSQGGITGAIAIPFIGDLIEGAVLSGAGGGLSLSLVYREEGGLDIEALIVDALDFRPDEVLDPLHPVAGLLQSISEPTDSVNYAPYWFDREAAWSTRPVPVLMFEGMLDAHTPPIATEALAAAAGIPVMAPAQSISDAHAVRGLDEQSAPAAANRTAWDGEPVTAGLAQYGDENHFAIYNESDAANLYRDFLISLAAGEPEILQP